MIHQQSLADYLLPLADHTESKERIGGYFTAIRLDELSAENVQASNVYSRKDFFKITLATGNATFHSLDNHFEIRPGESALIFTNREVPYRWDIHTEKCSGYSCMFTEDFLLSNRNIEKPEWSVFPASRPSVFRLSPLERDFFADLFLKMLSEQESSYRYKYDLIFLYVLECIHAAMKMQSDLDLKGRTASDRLTESFKVLMATQFPIVSPFQKLELHTAHAFAEKLGVHTNHLNRSLKAATGATTKQLIMERIMQEANALLLYSDWTISQISYTLGFDEPTHFSQAFKRITGRKPSSVRENV